MKVLSLFDGISCARVALDNAGIPVEMYYASEIDKYAISISQKNYPDIIQIGDVKDISSVGAEIDLLIGGSPCQDLSIAKRNREGLAGNKSSLFYEYVRILNEFKPKYFVLENVASMARVDKDTITKKLFGIEPVMINAALVSAQNRKRLFWCGELQEDGTYKQVVVPQPEDRGILLKDILIDGITERNKSLCVTATYSRANPTDYFEKHSRQLIYVGRVGNKDLAKDGKNFSRNAPQGDRIYDPEGKSVTLSANGGGRGAKTGLYLVNEYNKRIMVEKSGTLGTTMGRTAKQGYQVVDNKNSILRKLHPIECERLQSLPDNYTEGVSNTQRYKALGNGFNVEVISHILKYL